MAAKEKNGFSGVATTSCTINTPISASGAKTTLGSPVLLFHVKPSAPTAKASQQIAVANSL